MTLVLGLYYFIDGSAQCQHAFGFSISSPFLIISISASGELFWETAKQRTNSLSLLLLTYSIIRPGGKWTQSPQIEPSALND